MTRPGYSRREFIEAAAWTGLGLLPLTATLAAAQPQRQIGTQLYGWGQYYQRAGKNLSEHMGEALSAIRDIGFDYAEGSVNSANPDENARFAEQLRAKGLKPLSLYCGGAFHASAAQEKTLAALFTAAEACKKAGFSIINCNPDPIGRAKTAEELLTQLQGLIKFSNKLKDLGMQFGIHHHLPEFANNAEEFHYNFKRSQQLGFCYDVHWVYRGSVQPADALKLYGDRIVSWHLRQSRGGIWWEDLDKGDVDYAAIAEHARKQKLQPYYTVELAIEEGTKITRSVVENHRRSLGFVRDVFVA